MSFDRRDSEFDTNIVAVAGLMQACIALMGEYLGPRYFLPGMTTRLQYRAFRRAERAIQKQFDFARVEIFGR